jgi:hypothetical protein
MQSFFFGPRRRLQTAFEHLAEQLHQTLIFLCDLETDSLLKASLVIFSRDVRN